MDEDQCHPGCPQTSSDYTTLDQSWRSVTMSGSYQNDYSYEEGQHPMGGVSSLSAASWYRFVAPAGTRMPTEAPGYQRCNGFRTGWLSTAHPAAGDAPSAGTVCWQTSSSAAAECSYTTSVEVCACSYDGGATTTYTYKLPRPNSSSYFVYCGTSDAMEPPPPP